ncbi:MULTISPECIES: diguanylate cyclase domain-containing protein [unclassified Blastococcus]
MAESANGGAVVEARPVVVGAAFAHAPLGMAVCGTDGEFLAVNPALERLVGRPAGQLTGASLFDLTEPAERPAAREACASLQLRPETTSRLETRLLHADGSAVPVQMTASAMAAEEPTHLVVVVEDITDRKALEAQLVHRSLHDPLTGLPNRILFGDRLRHALERGHRERTPTCVLIVDLDGFKAVNDEYGHPMGDAVLVAFAERLTSVLRASDTAARLGGDEFSIVCENTEPPEAEVLADRLRTTVLEPLDIEGTRIPLGMSVGIGVAEPGADPDEACERVVRSADDAMYADKHRTR